MKFPRSMVLVGFYVIVTVACCLFSITGLSETALADGGGGTEPPIRDTIPSDTTVTTSGDLIIDNGYTTDLSYLDIIELTITFIL